MDGGDRAGDIQRRFGSATAGSSREPAAVTRTAERALVAAALAAEPRQPTGAGARRAARSLVVPVLFLVTFLTEAAVIWILAS
jgi:hypothetical protein